MRHFKNRINIVKTILMVIIFGLSLPLKSQTTSDGSSPQFLFPDFSKGQVSLKNGSSQTALLNYNTLSEKMVFEKEGKLYNLENSQMIDSVYLQNSKFVPIGKIYYEVLLIAPISLFIQNKSELVPAGTPAAYGGTSQVSSTKVLSSVELSGGYYNLKLPPDYIVKADPVYWIRKDNNMYSFMNERQFLKIFPDKEVALKRFIKQNRIKFDILSNLVSLVEHCNELNQ
ncbi:MAG: hypothetical protein NT144_12710 [Bacteroidia bacterium]|nr:hypothetical protein [Bacteroidia bacterium]